MKCDRDVTIHKMTTVPTVTKCLLCTVLHCIAFSDSRAGLVVSLYKANEQMNMLQCYDTTILSTIIVYTLNQLYSEGQSIITRANDIYLQCYFRKQQLITLPSPHKQRSCL